MQAVRACVAHYWRACAPELQPPPSWIGKRGCTHALKCSLLLRRLWRLLTKSWAVEATGGLGAPSHHKDKLDVGSWLGWRGELSFFLGVVFAWWFYLGVSSNLSWNSLSTSPRSNVQGLGRNTEVFPLQTVPLVQMLDVCMSTLWEHAWARQGMIEHLTLRRVAKLFEQVDTETGAMIRVCRCQGCGIELGSKGLPRTRWVWLQT